MSESTLEPPGGYVLGRRALLAGAGLTASALAAAKLGPRFYNARRLASLRGRRIYEKDDIRAVLQGALARASRENKRVLVVLGGDWCPWCLALDDMFEHDDELRRFVDHRFVVASLDGDAAHDLDEQWGRPTRQGVPVLVFLDAAGRLRHVEGTMPLEQWGGRILGYDRARLLAALRRAG